MKRITRAKMPGYGDAEEYTVGHRRGFNSYGPWAYCRVKVHFYPAKGARPFAFAEAYMRNRGGTYEQVYLGRNRYAQRIAACALARDGARQYLRRLAKERGFDFVSIEQEP